MMMIEEKFAPCKKVFLGKYIPSLSNFIRECHQQVKKIYISHLLLFKKWRGGFKVIYGDYATREERRVSASQSIFFAS